MVIKTENPYIEPLHKAHREDNESDIKKFNQLSREFIQGLLCSADNDYTNARADVCAVSKLPSARKQYQEACRLYKLADQLVKDLRLVKAELRRELKIGKFSGESQ